MSLPNGSNISTLSAEAFANLLSGPLLTISIGPDHKSWQIHHNLLNHFTPYFSNDSLTNGEEKRIDADNNHASLPDHDPAAFRIFVKWLYQGTIADVSCLSDKVQKWEYAFACQNLYFLAERLEITALKNLAIDQFRKGCFETRLVPGAEEIRPVYERTAVGSPFRKLVARIAARQIMDPDSGRGAGVYRECFEGSAEFAVDVVDAMREGVGGVLLDDPTEGNSCRYHEHGEGEGCQKVVRFEDEAGPRLHE